MTSDTNRRIRLLGLSGSLRRESHCTAVLRTLRDTLDARAEPAAGLAIHPLNDLPLYNQDEDGEAPPAAVAALRADIAGCDGLVVVSPEYNYGMSGVLKNALDWASRPYGRSALRGKPAVVMTASPAATGGVRAQASLRETLSATMARVVVRPQVAIAGVRDKVRDGRLADEAALRFALEAVDDLLREIRMVSAAKGC